MPAPHIRPAAAGDLPAVTSIYADAVLHGTATYELTAPDLDEMRRRYGALIAGGYPYLVAEAQGEVLGYAYAGAFRDRPAYRFVVEDSVYLARQAQGRGIGRLLLGRLIEAATLRGFCQMIAVIGDGHPASPSVRLHTALGFAETGRLEGSGYKFGRWLDTVFMQIALNRGNMAPPDPRSVPERRFRGEKV